MTSSPWAPEKAKEGAELRFEFREQAIDYMGELMRLHMFHRARKVPVAEKEKKKKKDETETEEEEKPSPKAKKGKKDDKKVYLYDNLQSDKYKILNFRRRKKKKRKRKSARFVLKCIMTRCSLTAMTLTCGSITLLHGKNLKHCKSNLTSGLIICLRYYYIAGSAIVLGIIAVCLFPLWPMEMRQGL